MFVDKLLQLTGKDESLVGYVEDRLGHGRRYSVDITKMTKLGWRRERTLDEALEHTMAVPRQRLVVAAPAGPQLMRAQALLSNARAASSL